MINIKFTTELTCHETKIRLRRSSNHQNINSRGWFVVDDRDDKRAAWGETTTVLRRARHISWDSTKTRVWRRRAHDGRDVEIVRGLVYEMWMCEWTGQRTERAWSEERNTMMRKERERETKTWGGLYVTRAEFIDGSVKRDFEAGHVMDGGVVLDMVSDKITWRWKEHDRLTNKAWHQKKCML